MRVLKYALAIMLVPALVQAQAGAKPTTDEYGKIETVLKEMKPLVEAILVQQQRSLNDGCNKLAVLMPGSLSIFDDLEMRDGKPAKGRWNVRYAVDVCGVPVLRNVAMRVVNGEIAIEPLVPGDSLTDTQLQADVLKSFGLAGRVIMPECTESPVIREAKVRVFPKTGKDAWQEFWIGRMCGRDIGQVVTFTPNDKGTAFKMALPKTPETK